MRKVKLFLIIFCFLFLIGCENFINKEIDYTLQTRFSDIPLYYTTEWDRFLSPIDITNWITNNVYYKYDPIDHVQTPEETVLLGYGDCEDFALLYANMLYMCLNLQSDLMLVYLPTISKTIINGGYPNHVVLYLNGFIIETETGHFCPKTQYKYVIQYTYPFRTVFNM